MSKRSKRKNKHQFQSNKKEEGQSEEASVDTKPASLDTHIDDLELKSMKVSGTDSTAKEGGHITSGEVKVQEEVDTKKVPEMEATEGSNKAVWAFMAGIVIGAIIVSVLF
jgi:hypothetical protein